MILRILAVLVIAVIAVLAYTALRPGTFTVQRSVHVDAAAEKIVPLIDNFHNWPQWAPQDREDATMKRTFGGAAAGVGATSDWAGARDTGKGRLTITESTPAQITVQADWQRPFATRNVNTFALVPDGTGTTVTWTLTGRNLYMMKLMGIFVSMDKMMGKHLESGLANLKAAAEK
jgi:hypothetical protein